ncbi:MAG: hypothetical protein IPL55_21505 [Saprospiraceae bacterium]|nr:hypothetical protein [Saprospiraceae bacterium]
MAAQIQALNKQAYISYVPEVDYLIIHRVKDDKTIQHILDGLLDFCGDENVLLLYKKLCRYYWDVNPQATANYINFYREMWDHEN